MYEWIFFFPNFDDNNYDADVKIMMLYFHSFFCIVFVFGGSIAISDTIQIWKHEDKPSLKEYTEFDRALNVVFIKWCFLNVSSVWFFFWFFLSQGILAKEDFILVVGHSILTAFYLKKKIQREYDSRTLEIRQKK